MAKNIVLEVKNLTKKFGKFTAIDDDLLITGWGFGLIVAGLIVYFGMRIQAFAWSGITLIFPFSGVFYPISTLPSWAQQIAHFLPTSYIFEGMREVVFRGSMPLEMLLKSFGLNLILFIFGLTFFVVMFEKSKERGLSRLE